MLHTLLFSLYWSVPVGDKQYLTPEESSFVAWIQSWTHTQVVNRRHCH